MLVYFGKNNHCFWMKTVKGKLCLPNSNSTISRPNLLYPWFNMYCSITLSKSVILNLWVMTLSQVSGIRYFE